jgi:hypothetical protein
VDSLVNDRYNTVGGTLFLGSVGMLEHYNGGYDAQEIFNTWIIFGDCSVQMRTDSPAAMVASYPAAVLVGTQTVSVSIPGVSDALVGISANAELLGSGYTNASGMVDVVLGAPLDTPGTVTITITAYNKVPIQDDIEVIPPSGPYLVYQSSAVLGDGQADIGETVSLNVELKNVGIETAYAVQSTLSTASAEIALTAPTQSYGDVAANATALPAAPFQFYVGSLVDGTIVPFDLDIVSGVDSWEAAFPITIHAPVLTQIGWQIDDGAGNSDGGLDPGETVALTLTVGNSGSGTAQAVQLTLSENDPNLEISGPATQAMGDIPAGGQAVSAAFTVVVDAACPAGQGAQLFVQMASNGGIYTASGSLNLLIGQAALLLVDSDPEATETRVAEALAGLGIGYTRWNTYDVGHTVVPLDTLVMHQAVLWVAGDQSTTSVSVDNQTNLISYLNQGGRLILSAENFAPTYALAPLTTTYLHIASSQANISGTAVYGVAADPIGDGVSVTLDYPAGLDAGPDQANPASGAATVFRMQGGNNSVAIRYPSEGSATYRTVFFGVPLEAFPTSGADPNNIAAVIARSLAWLSGGTDVLAPTSPADPTMAQDGTLSWSPATDNVGVDHYRVYRSLTAFFNVQGMTPWATPTGTSVQITEGFGDVALNYTYRITAQDAAGNESSASVPVGEFDFQIEQ